MDDVALAKAGGAMRSLVNNPIYAPLQAHVEKRMADEFKAADEHEATLLGLSLAVEAVLRGYLKRRKS